MKSTASLGVQHFGRLSLSAASIALIIEFEVGGKDYYNRRLMWPTWSGGDSGVTIGFGYDLGYNTAEQVRADWSEGLPSASVSALCLVCGIKGTAAKEKVKRVATICVPWETAARVFEARTLPRFAMQAADAFPGIEQCHPHVQGALVSLVFNRGPSLKGKRREEMMAIHNILKDGVQAGDYAAIATQLREMKALWRGKGLDGLLRRRDAEAALVLSAI